MCLRAFVYDTVCQCVTKYRSCDFCAGLSIHTCMFVRMYVYMYECIYVCMYVGMYVCM